MFLGGTRVAGRGRRSGLAADELHGNGLVGRAAFCEFEIWKVPPALIVLLHVGNFEGASEG
jgi:hypothetical protein